MPGGISLPRTRTTAAGAEGHQEDVSGTEPGSSSQATGELVLHAQIDICLSGRMLLGASLALCQCCIWPKQLGLAAAAKL